MNKVLSARRSGNIVIVILAAMLVLHLLILSDFVPYEFVWGGQIDDRSSLMMLEGVAVLTTLLFILIISLKIGHIQIHRLEKTATVGVWIIVAYFLLNTLGNLASGITLEKLISTPVTIILTLLAFRVATQK